MGYKSRKLGELDQLIESHKFDEIEDFEEFDESEEIGESEGIDESEEFDKSVESEASTIKRRKANISYQNERKKKLKRLGENQINIRLDAETFARLCDLCEVLGYRRPTPKMHNLIEIYSEVFKYLLRTSDESFEYKPKAKRSVKALKIYKYVDHLNSEKKLSKNVIISDLQKNNITIPFGEVGGKKVGSGKYKDLEQYFDKNKLIRLLEMVDKKL